MLPKTDMIVLVLMVTVTMEGLRAQLPSSGGSSRSSCPWPEDMTDLVQACTCSSSGSRLRVQCDKADMGRVLGALRGLAVRPRLELLAVSNSSVPVLIDNMFGGLVVSGLRVTGSRLAVVQPGAFRGLERQLLSLDLSKNLLTSVPRAALAPLAALQSLDLSENKITRVDDREFSGTSSLSSLRLSGNNLTLSEHAFSGLENSLRTLIVKNNQLNRVPTAVRHLQRLRFLDLAQNYFTRLNARAFSSLDSLSALNLERNMIQIIDDEAFQGINDTLTSLSLLNNLISEFPRTALASIPRLRVLDVGFNLIAQLQNDSFTALPSLALLALDGNPITTLPETTFKPLANTLKGLSLGGRFLNCDCHLSWIPTWIRDKNLQVTSREQDPQFCGSPQELHNKNLYHIKPHELVCRNESAENEQEDSQYPIDYHQFGEIGLPSEEIEIKSADIIAGKPAFVSAGEERIVPTTKSKTDEVVTEAYTPNTASTSRTTQSRKIYSQPRRPVTTTRPAQPPNRPNLLFRGNERRNEERRSGIASRVSQLEEVKVEDAYRIDNSVVIQWDSEVENILGFRVIYRLFGDKSFKQGPPLASSEKEFKIKNVPSQECIVVCVVSLEEIDLTPASVPPRQCREVRTDPDLTTHIDTFVIAASAAICTTIILAVVIFVCCNRRRQQRSQDLPTILSTTPGPPLASMGALRGEKEWDQLSMYSQRSIPRARMYHMDKGLCGDDFRSQLTRASTRRRSMIEPAPPRSYSALSVAHLPALASSHALALSRQDIRASRASLVPAALEGGVMASSLLGHHHLHHRCHENSELENDLLHSHQQAAAERGRRSSRRPSRANSRAHHYGANDDEDDDAEETDGWTDHDMDIYMTTNATAGHNNLVQL